jgi:hypothetical protein
MSTGEITVTRWRRYGKDRLYVARADAAKLGWWDLLTDEAHPEYPADLETLSHAVDRWKADNMSLSGPARVPAEPPLTPESAASAAAATSADHSPQRPWVDLSTNRAGAEAREQAEAARDAAPVRTVLARVLRVHSDERAWRIGADGEEKVAAQLTRLARKDPRWRFVHAIPVGNRGSDIDHLVVGPGGVFTVNAKHHPRAKIWVGGNTFLVNGHKQHYIRNSRHESDRAAKLLTAACGRPIHVEGLIVTVNAADVVVKSPPAGVHVTWRKNVVSWFRRLGDVLGAEEIDAVYEAARRSTTWSSPLR